MFDKNKINDSADFWSLKRTNRPIPSEFLQPPTFIPDCPAPEWIRSSVCAIPHANLSRADWIASVTPRAQQPTQIDAQKKSSEIHTLSDQFSSAAIKLTATRSGVSDRPFAVDVQINSNFCKITWTIPRTKFDSHQLIVEVKCGASVVIQETIDSRVPFHEFRVCGGKKYEIGVKLVAKSGGEVYQSFSQQVRAIFSAVELDNLFVLAKRFLFNSPTQWTRVLYRVKPQLYFTEITNKFNGIMQPYLKDYSGHAASPINGQIDGLFFSGFHQNGQLPATSPFGDTRFSIDATELLDPTTMSLYFTDFYCSNKPHYVTLIVCARNSTVDRFCQANTKPLDFGDNPFLRIVQSTSGQPTVFISCTVYVEICFTEPVDLKRGRLEQIRAFGAGTSISGGAFVFPSPELTCRLGLSNNKNCQKCNFRMNERTLTKFVEWSKRHGVNLEAAEPRQLGADRGCGLVAKRAIRCNEIFLRVYTIPKSLIITAGVVADLPEYAQLLTRYSTLQHARNSCAISRLDPFTILVLFFYQETQNANSPFRDYLNVLPSEFTTPLATTDLGKEIPVDQLPLRLRDLLEKQRLEFEQVRKKISELLDLDLNRLNWAWHVVNTRCIYLENPPHPLVDSLTTGDSIAVIPMVDMANHDPKAQCVGRFDKHDQQYVVAADHCFVAEGDELFVCYGPHDNPRLWIEYGFCLPDNLFNRVDLPINLFIAIARKLNIEVTTEKQRLIQEAALPCTTYASDIQPSHGLKTNCSILLMSRDQIPQAKKLIYGNPTDLNDNPAVMDLAYRVIGELNATIKRRAESAPQIYRHFWDEQTEILENLLKLRDGE
ncbi:SET domain-containing protein [Aphelenchoides besseyi]|nr:SET domain-containing protein [Aphelenchoides besseyi]